MASTERIPPLWTVKPKTVITVHNFKFKLIELQRRWARAFERLNPPPTTLPITLSAIDPENSIKITHFYYSNTKKTNKQIMTKSTPPSRSR